MTNRTRSAAVAATAVAALLVADVAAAEVLVVRSSGPSAARYRPGSSLADNARVALQAGDLLIVLAGSASRALRGPGTFAVGASSAAAGARAAVRRGRFNALRVAGIVPHSTNIWDVDVSQSGKVCVHDAANVSLWRPEADAAVPLTVTGPDGTTGTVQWAAGADTVAWPREVPVRPGADYRLTWPGAPEPTLISFATLAAEPADLAGVAQALIGEDCQNQLDALIETSREDEAG